VRKIFKYLSKEEELELEISQIKKFILDLEQEMFTIEEQNKYYKLLNKESLRLKNKLNKLQKESY